jgi:hypothetical protein
MMLIAPDTRMAATAAQTPLIGVSRAKMAHTTTKSRIRRIV